MHKLATILPLLAALGCSAPRFDATPRVASLGVSGEFGAGLGSLSGTNDLGMERDDASLGLRLDAELGIPAVRASVQSIRSDGSATLSTPIQVGAMTIPAGASARSSLKLDQGEVLVLFDLLGFTSTASVELGFGAAVIDFDQEVAGAGQMVRSAETVPLPVLALDASVELGPFELAGLVSGMAYDAGDDEASYLSVDLFGRWAFVSGPLRASLALGYRAIDIDVKYSDSGSRFELDYLFDGPYLGIELSF